MDDSRWTTCDAGPNGEDELLDRLRQGDSAVLRHLLKRYLHPLRHYAEGILNGSGDPQEVVQEAFIRLWTHRERWRNEGSIRSILYTITRNAAVDELRKRRREVPLPQPPHAALRAPATDPLDRVVEAELREAAEAAISRLPPRRQEIFRMVREQELSYKEVARVLEISTQTVANLMSLALRDLRVALAPALREEQPAGGQPGGPGPSLHVSGSD